MIRFTVAQKIKTLLILNHLLAGSLVFYGNLNYIWLTVLGVFLFGKIGGEIGFHRYFSHKAFKTENWKSRLLLILGSLNMLGSSLSWCGTHRTHHVNADRTDDPHSPHTQHWLKVWLLHWKPFIIKPRYVSDFLRDSWHMFIHNYYFELCLAILIVGIYFDYNITVFLFSLSSVISFHTGSLLVDVFCHRWGYRNFETNDKSTNNTWVNLYTGGTGLHNNHHQNPGDWNFVRKKGEWDLWGSFIKYFLIKHD